MKKSKMRKWLIGIGLFLAVALISGYLVMNYAVNKVLNTLAGGSLSVSELVGQPTATPVGGVSFPVESAKPTPGSLPTVKAESSPAGMAISPAPVATGQVGSSISNVTAKPSNSPTTSSNTSSSNPTAQKTSYNGEVTQEKAAAAEQQITLTEKAQISTILLKKLTAEDMSLLVKLSGGGMSLDEKREAKKVVLQRLSEAEYNSLIAVAAKLGLSQGKSYEESLKEFP